VVRSPLARRRRHGGRRVLWLAAVARAEVRLSGHFLAICD